MKGQKVFGESVTRLEDPALLTGKGRFVDDIILPGLLNSAFVRSPHAHALIKNIDKTAALNVDGVHAVFTLKDFRPYLVNERLVVGLPSPSYQQDLNRPALADGEVVYVGEPVAIVIADSRYLAEDSVSLVDVEYQTLPVISDCRDALKENAPTVHIGSPHNVLAEFDMGYGEVNKAFKNAKHVFAEKFWQHRGGSHSIECRGSVASYDSNQNLLTLYSATQAAHTAKNILIDMLGLNENHIRVIIPDVGGGFGPKLVFYPEDVSVVLSSLILKRPVKWIEDRREHFISTTQERDQFWDVEIAIDNAGLIMGIRGAMVHDHGAYTARGINLAYNSALIVTLPYDVPCYQINVVLALTNKVPVTPVRGAGHPQGIFVMERLLDRAARELKIKPSEIRRRNLISKDRMPFTKGLKTRGGAPVVLDSGDFHKCMDEALVRINFNEFEVRQKIAREQGRFLGLGIGNYVKGTGRGPFEPVNVRIGLSGKVLIYSGAAAMGQSTHTMLSQIVADQLGGDMNNIEVITGDTAVIALGIGGSASRQTVTAGSSAFLAAQAVRKKVLKVASHILEAPEEDLEIEGTEVRVKGVSSLKISFANVAHAVAGTPGYALPNGIDPGMEASRSFVIDDLTFVNGTVAVEVEVDPETGHVLILKYVIVHDCGTVINPMIVDGQVVGGAAHGIGNSLFEWMGFDENAQPITTNLAEYLLVTATEMPQIELGQIVSPTPLNPLGVKGVGECGVVSAPAAIIGAVENALEPFGIHIDQVPIRPDEIVAKIYEGL